MAKPNDIDPHGGVPIGRAWAGVDEFGIGLWYPSPDGTGKPEAVQVNYETVLVVPGIPPQPATIIMRIKSAARLDQIVRDLLKYRKQVWPNEPVNVY